MGTIVEEKRSRGFVIRQKGRSVWIQLVEDCTTEVSCQGGCAGCGGKKNSRTVMAQIDDDTNYSNGTHVTVQYVSINEFIGALAVFGIPLSFPLVSLLLWYLFAPQQVESGMSILSAGIAFVAGFLPVRLINGSFRKRFPSRIVSVSSPAVNSLNHTG